MSAHRTAFRRGANAIEFALVAPVLVVMLGSILDFGWYFWREALALNALREGARAGSLKQPDLLTESAGTCSACTGQAATATAAALQAQGFPSGQVTTYLERTPATGTPCTYSLVVEESIPHERLFPLIPGPDQFRIRVASMAQNVSCS